MRIVLPYLNLRPYHLAQIRALTSWYDDLHIIICNSKNNELDLAPLKATSGVKFHSHDLGNQNITKLLAEIDPDVVFSISYGAPFMRAIANWAKLNHRVSICVTDSWKGDKRRYLPLEIYKGRLCRFLYDGMFVSGIRSLDYYAGLGFPDKFIWRGCDVVDNQYFSENAFMACSKSDDYRDKYHLPAEYFLCVARFSPEKNLYRLLEAFKRYRQRQGSWSLVLVGDGPLRVKLEKITKEIDTVFAYPWQGYDKLPIFYGLASCFILPSVSEPWGLVINEAMASGLPVAVSRKCGCQPELCWRGFNGIDFSPFDIDEIVETMFYFTNMPKSKLAEMGTASELIIQQYTPLKASQALADCINAISRHSPVRK
jgi:1,2-diacylglycerol 3-alpha-glucosyltransferase